MAKLKTITTNSKVVYRDAQGVEYVSGPLPSHEVTDPVPLTARMVGRKLSKRVASIYEGTDGAELVKQPRNHRQHWNDTQWVAFEEYRRDEAQMSREDLPMATALFVKSKRAR